MDHFQYKLMVQTLNSKKTKLSKEIAEKFVNNFVYIYSFTYSGFNAESKPHKYKLNNLSGRKKRLAKVLYLKIKEQNIEQSLIMKDFMKEMKNRYG